MRVSVGDQVPNFTCRGEVNSPWALLNLTWSKLNTNGMQTVISSKTSVQTVVSRLQLGQVGEQDAGDYICDVQSLGESVANDRSSFTLVRLVVYRKYRVAIKKCVVYHHTLQ